MEFLKKISNALTPRDRSEGDFYPLRVKCAHCGEYVQTSVNLMNDLSVRYGESGKQDTYFCRKVLIGKNKRCYRRIEVELVFDKNRRLLDRQIDGGSFID